MKVLNGTITVQPDPNAEADADDGLPATYADGTHESDIDPAHLERIQNPSAWREVDDDGAGDVGDIIDGTREALLTAAERSGLKVGEDFPKSASKEVIAATIKRKLFGDANPDAELTGDTPAELADADVGGTPDAEATTTQRRRQRPEPEE